MFISYNTKNTLIEIEIMFQIISVLFLNIK